MASDRDLEDAAKEVKEFAKKAASDRPTPQFEYLVQAIVDAVDAIGL